MVSIKVSFMVSIKVSIMVSIKVSIMVSIKVSIKVRHNINKMKWMNHISALREFCSTGIGRWKEVIKVKHKRAKNLHGG